VSLAPLLNAPLAIQLHAFAAMAAFALGLVQLTSVKGTTQHRGRGFVWAGLMLIVAVSSFWVHEIRLWGPWKPDPLVVDPHAYHAAAGDLLRPHASGAPASERHAEPVLRSPGHRGDFHPRARAHHAQGGVRRLTAATLNAERAARWERRASESTARSAYSRARFCLTRCGRTPARSAGWRPHPARI